MQRQFHFRLLFHYLRLAHNFVYYKHIYLIGKEYIPPKGNAVILAGNHQNAINDPLSLEFGFADRPVSIFAHSGLFKNRFSAFFFRGIRVLPAYRLKNDGEAALTQNYDSFNEADQRLLNGEAIAIYPEGTNQTRHVLGDFSTGYLRMAFEAAEKAHFNQDIIILPVSTHYSDYFRFRGDMMVSCGNPVHLADYYSMYQTKPRTAQRQVNDLIHERVRSLMLDITDEAHAEDIEFVLNTFGKDLAKKQGLNPEQLPEKLQADQQLAALLQQWLQQDKEQAETYFDQIKEYRKGLQTCNARHWMCKAQSSTPTLISNSLLCLIGLPLAILACIPNIAVYYAPLPLVNKFKKMGGTFVLFTGGVQFGINAIVVLPLCYTLVFVLEGCFWCWPLALIHLLLQIPLGLFAWNYRSFAKKTIALGRLQRLRKRNEWQVLLQLCDTLWQKTQKIGV